MNTLSAKFSMKALTITIFLGIITLAGCKSLNTRGQFVSADAVEKINATKPDKSEVINIIGTPTYIPDYTSNTWYYIERVSYNRAWFEDKLERQNTIKITFDKNNHVREAVFLKDQCQENIAISSEYTKTHGTEKSGVQKFFGNMGKYSKNKKTNVNRGKKKTDKVR